MNTLESRKQLLLAESELNRAQLTGDIRSLKAGVRALTHGGASLGPVASSAAALATGLAAFQRGQRAAADAKPSRLELLLEGAVLMATVWLAFRAQSHHQRDPRET